MKATDQQIETIISLVNTITGQHNGFLDQVNGECGLYFTQRERRGGMTSAEAESYIAHLQVLQRAAAADETLPTREGNS